MSRIFVHGIGATSPAGWTAKALFAAIKQNRPLPTVPLKRPGWDDPLKVRTVPPPSPRPAFLAHPRLRRASSITHYTVASALEALREDAVRVRESAFRLGIVVCVMAGSVNYSRRFYEEVLNDPATASPLVFPETVFNAPASHLAACLGCHEISCTLVGDDGMFLQGLALAAHWLLLGKVDGCIVIGAEETDWIVPDAMRLFQHGWIHSSGAGALHLRANPSTSGTELSQVTDAFNFVPGQNRNEAAKRMRDQLRNNHQNELLVLGTQGLPRSDEAELAAWRDWTGHRISPKTILGEAFVGSAAWQCVAACAALEESECTSATVSVVGANQQAIGARFTRDQLSAS